jgi:hypothetical protein
MDDPEESDGKEGHTHRDCAGHRRGNGISQDKKARNDQDDAEQDAMARDRTPCWAWAGSRIRVHHGAPQIAR